VEIMRKDNSGLPVTLSLSDYPPQSQNLSIFLSNVILNLSNFL
jgi:hypothetical protein